MAKVYLGLGANVGDPYLNIQRAIALIAGWATIKCVSPLYRTRPCGCADQGEFLNGALLLETDETPLALRERLKEVERTLGRTETAKNGPREIDLDILLYDELVMVTAPLCIPHADLTGRDFVLVPLLDIAPLLVDPATGDPLARFLNHIPSEERYLLGVAMVSPHQGVPTCD
jgi:2-amino-4-hydroxy-6-hydroxymethyldihydropteridine diphosphokinase